MPPTLQALDVSQFEPIGRKSIAVFEQSIYFKALLAEFVGKRAVEKAAPWKSPKAGLSPSAWKSRKSGGIPTVKGGVKPDHWGGVKVDQLYMQEIGDFRGGGRLERRPAPPARRRV